MAYDRKFSILAISPKARLAPNTKGIASSLAKLLNSDTQVSKYNVTIEINQIPDPEGFIEQLYSAYAVVGFMMEFGEPNPFDVDKDFHRPMERLLETTGGKKGSTKISGEDLDREQMESLSRSVASAGNDAAARIKRAPNDRPILRHLKGDPASFAADSDEAQADPKGILRKLRETYLRIRHSE